MSNYVKEQQRNELQVAERAILPDIDDDEATELVRHVPEPVATTPTKLEHRIDARYTPAERTVDELIRARLMLEQLRAIELIIAGASDREAAHAIGMHRVTVARWRLYHPAFIAELNRRRDNIMQNSADKLRNLASQAIAVLGDRVRDVTRPELQLKAAVSLLRLSGTDRLAQRRGELSPDDLIEARAFQKRKQEQWGMIDHGEREDVLVDLARRAESAMVEETGDDVSEPAPREPERSVLPEHMEPHLLQNATTAD